MEVPKARPKHVCCRGSRYWGSPFSPLSIPPGTMGCSCSSNPEDDWMENIDVCENCHYPIVPLDGKATVRGKTGDLVREVGGVYNTEKRHGPPLHTLEIIASPLPCNTERKRSPERGRDSSKVTQQVVGKFSDKIQLS